MTAAHDDLTSGAATDLVAGGFWQSHDVVYTAGDIDFIPAGLRESWEQPDATTVVDVSLARSFVRRSVQTTPQRQ